MRRREFFVGLVLPLLACTAWAQQTGRVWRIGYLAQSPRPEDDVFRQALHKLGYVEGGNLTTFYRWGESGNYEALAEDLVRLKVDLIVAVTSRATRAALDATKTIPIVMTGVGDPVAYGFIASLARPGGNITGTSNQLSDAISKELELMKEMIPAATKLALLAPQEDNPGAHATVATVVAAAPSFGFEVKVYGIAKSDDFAAAFTAIVREGADVLVVIPDHFLYVRRALIIDFARTNRIPAMYGMKEYVTGGGLIALSPNRQELAKRTAVQVDKILKGVKPADLPVEQPTKFELFVNVKTAKALGLTVPGSILLRADEVIE
jgi:putative ABC transport system substrate-binding protein